MSFSLNDPGETNSVATWGVDTAWPSFDNVRQSIVNIEQSNVEAVRLPVVLSEPLVSVVVGNYELNAEAKAVGLPP